MELRSHSGIYTLFVKHQLPVSLEKAWNFFSKPENLDKLTPSVLGFKITSKPSAITYPGQIITYKIGIFPGIKSNWVTEITVVKDKSYFVDEQRFGPYKMWHHEHHFIENERGTEMIDKVSFALPLGFLGHIAYHLYVKRKLTEIFNFRFQVIEELLK